MIKIFSNKLVLAMLALMVGTVANAAVKLSIGKVTGVLPKATIEIPVYLENDADVSTVGFDVRLPKGITPTAMAKNNERAKGSQGWACNIQPTVENPGAFRAGLYSFEKKPVRDSSLRLPPSVPMSSRMATSFWRTLR